MILFSPSYRCCPSEAPYKMLHWYIYWGGGGGVCHCPLFVFTLAPWTAWVCHCLFFDFRTVRNGEVPYSIMKERVKCSAPAWWQTLTDSMKIISAHHNNLLPWLRLQCTKQVLKKKAFSGFQVCVGISCVRLTRNRLHTQSVWWPVLQPTSSGLDYNSKSFHITAISALPMAVRSRNLNPHLLYRNVQWNKLGFQQVRRFKQFTHI